MIDNDHDDYDELGIPRDADQKAIKGPTIRSP
jgi:hypothetical protein